MRVLGIRDEILGSTKGKARLRREVFNVDGRDVVVNWVEGTRVPDIVIESIYRDISEELGIERGIAEKVIGNVYGWMRSSMSNHEYSGYGIKGLGHFDFIARESVGYTNRGIRDLEMNSKGRVFLFLLNRGTRHVKIRSYSKVLRRDISGCIDLVERIVRSDAKVMFEKWGGGEIDKGSILFLLISGCCGCRGELCWWHRELFDFMTCEEIEAIGALIGIKRDNDE